ncbi:hypothetical protein JKP88DRAFT_164594, partial [Tribonema minus]
FWRALSSASVDADGCLKLPAGTWFMGNRDFGSAIYIRDCYCNLMEQINKLVAARRVQRVVITGTPGIGKTCYAFYWLWHLRQTGRTVVYQLGPGWYRFCGATAVQGSRKAFLAAGYLDDPAAWYLSDPADWFGGITLVFVTPRWVRYHEFLKAPAATKRFMPVWSEEELLRCAELLFSGQDLERDVPQARVRELFRRWGGVPRYVLQYAHDDERQGTLTAAIHHCSVGDLHAAIRSTGEGTGTTVVLSDKLVHIHTCGAFTSKRLMWASDYVFDEFCSAQEKSLRLQLAAFLVRYLFWLCAACSISLWCTGCLARVGSSLARSSVVSLVRPSHMRGQFTRPSASPSWLMLKCNGACTTTQQLALALLQRTRSH